MRSFGGGGGFGFAGVESMAAKLAIGLVAGSLLVLLTGSLGQNLLLHPRDVFDQFQLWQPFTYAFIGQGAMGIIFGAIIIYSIGGPLEASWGSRRLLWVLWGGTVLAGFLTALVAQVVSLPIPYSGGYVMSTIAWVSYGLYIGRGQANFWGIPVTGNVLALIGAGFVVINALTSHWILMVPEFFALGIAFVYMRGGSPRQLWLRLQHARLQRQLRGRSKHLRVISSERPDDRFLN
jgi:hypothetical protein